MPRSARRWLRRSAPARGPAADERDTDGSQARLPVAPAPGDGHPRHVLHHRPARPAVRTRDQAVLQPGLPAGHRPARASQPEDPHGAAGHPGLRHGRPHRTCRRRPACQEYQGRRRRARRRGPAAQAGADHAGRPVTTPAEAVTDPEGTTMELFTAFDRAVASTADVVKATPAGQMSAHTPCTEWDVRALLNHVIGTLWLAAGLF